MLGISKLVNVQIVLGLMLVVPVYACTQTTRVSNQVVEHAPSGAVVGPVSESEQSAADEAPQAGSTNGGNTHLDELMKRVEVSVDARAPGAWLRLDSGREPFSISSMPGARALSTAAKHYAEVTLDFDPTPRKLLARGYWPFNNIPPGEMDRGLDQLSICRVLMYNGEQTWELVNATEPEGILDGKYRILLECYRSLADEADRSAVSRLLPTLKDQMNPAFWINPYGEEPMTVSTIIGDYRYIDCSLVYHPNFGTENYSQPMRLTEACVPLVNRGSSRGETASSNGLTQRTASSKQCCIFQFNESQWANQ